jgi:hypothetical protein
MAKPIKGTQNSDLFINGTNNDDKMQGKGGDDTLKGGAGDDDIDGGQGTDTAVYDGSYIDFDIVFKGTGNNKLTVTDTNTSDGDEGSDSLKHVEFLRFRDAVVNVSSGDTWTYAVNAEIDESAQKPATEDMINGSGIPATGFGIATNEDRGIELGLQVIYRQGPTVTTTDDYADGVLNFEVNDGPQSTANGSSANNANRASWSFEYSIATGLNGETTDLNDFTFKLLIDTDPGASETYTELHLVYDPAINNPGTNTADSNGYVWKNDANVTIIPDDDGVTPTVTQNSQNYAFYGIPTYNAGTAFAGPAEFDIVLQAFSGSTLVAQNHISVDVLA